MKKDTAMTQGGWPEIEMLAVNLLKAHLFGLTKNEQKSRLLAILCG